ncbi:NUDIX domain-containing protein, partial [Zhenhengia sp.]|uniref:NUDIX hydrolase n=1 Tax=Zhenhengia sp. TaxID=2944208 RepID=UPI00307ABF41
MIEVKFYEEVPDELLEFAVIVSRYQDKWVYCKHRERDTLEVPGGHREEGEDIFDTAERELYEETGALGFKLKDMGIYSVINKGKETFGRLYFANIEEFTDLPPSEIEKVVLCEEMPKALTYPLIHPKLVDYVRQKLKEEYLLLEEETAINKQVVIRGMEIQLLSIVKEEGTRKLLMLYQEGQAEKSSIHRKDYKTNREKMIERLQNEPMYGLNNLYIKAINFAGQEFMMEGSSARGLRYYHESDYETYTYFKEKGLIPKEWLEGSMEELILSEYRLESDTELPVDNLNKLMPMILNVAESHYTVRIEHSFRVNIGKAEPNTRIQYFDEATGKKRVFYIDEVEKYYYYDEGLQRLEEILQNIEPAEREHFKEEYIKLYLVDKPPPNAL